MSEKDEFDEQTNRLKTIVGTLQAVDAVLGKKDKQFADLRIDNELLRKQFVDLRIERDKLSGLVAQGIKIEIELRKEIDQLKAQLAKTQSE